MALTGKRAVITGPAKGKSAAITLTLARAGADLMLAGRDTAAIDPLADQARAMGRAVAVMACDITGPAQVADLARRAGTVKVLVTVTGGRGPVGKTGIETTRAMPVRLICWRGPGFCAGCMRWPRAIWCSTEC